MEETKTYKIYLNSTPNGVTQPNGTFSGQNGSDFYVNIPLILNRKKFDEYVKIDKDKSTNIIQRNNFNPFFIELGFFSSIKTVNSSGQTNSNVYSDTESIDKKAKLYNITINR